jgi:type IV secretory pathway TraG/TraD family ATPase VirD4
MIGAQFPVVIAVQHDNLREPGIVGAQTKGQFHMIYGTEGTQALFTGLATQIVYGGCDHDTADFYSKASGTTTADANPDPQKANFRQRPLLTVDEVVTPQIGNCVFDILVLPQVA